jgi:hypothetical protein
MTIGESNKQFCQLTIMRLAETIQIQLLLALKMAFNSELGADNGTQPIYPTTRNQQQPTTVTPDN